MPSPGIPKMVSTPHSIRVSTRMSPPVLAIILLLGLSAFFENSDVAVRAAAGRPGLLRRVRRWTKDDVARDLRGVGHPGQRHRDAELVLQDLERLGDAGLTISAEPIEIGAADEAGAGAEPEELQDVETRAYAAVDIDLRLVANRVDDAADDRSGGRRTVKLAAAVIRNQDRVGAGADRHLRIVHVHDALDDELARPERTHPFECLDVERAVELALHQL